jgi:hypothetical protein
MSDPTPVPAPPRPDSISSGVRIALLLHLAALGFCLMIYVMSRVSQGFGVLLFPLIFAGVSQLVYLIPAAVMQKRRGRPQAMKGIILVAAITVLLNVTCGVLVLGNLRIR